jgi:hypothetical protein
MNNESGIYTGSQGDRSSSDHSIVSGFYGSSSQSSLYGRELLQSKENNISLKHSVVDNDSTHFLTSYQSSASSEQQTFKPSYSSFPATVGMSLSYLDCIFFSWISMSVCLYKQHIMRFYFVLSLIFQKKKTKYTVVFWGFTVDSTLPNMKLRDSDSEVEQDMRFNYPMNLDFGERNFSSSTSNLRTVHDTAAQTSESTGFNSNSSRRSRPSFLDSLNVSRSSSSSYVQRTEPEDSFIINTSKSNGIDALGSSAFQKLPVETKTDRSLSEMASSNMPSSVDNATKFSVSLTNGVGIMNTNTNENIMERKHEFYQPMQNEDFSALEQVPCFLLFNICCIVLALLVSF